MPPRKVPADDVLIEMYERPISPRAMAQELGLNVNTVAAALSRIPDFKKRNCSEAQILANKQGKEHARYWKGKKQPRAMVEKRMAKIRGDKHYLWKGGRSRRGYRGKIKKEKCVLCDSRQNLCIHHIDFDHYNNAKENLLVLCVSCHMSLHKQAYWDAIKAGKEPPKSTGECYWKDGDWQKWRAKNRERYNAAQRKWNERRKADGR